MPLRSEAAASSPSPLDFELEWQRAGEGARDVRRLARDMVRTVGQAGTVEGTTDVVRLDADGLVTIVNCRLPHLVRWNYRADETHVMLRASLACDVRFRFDGLAPMVFDRPQLTLACLPKRVPLVVDIAGNARQQGIIAIFRAATFARRFGLRPEDLPAELLRAQKGAPGGHVASFPVDHRVAAIVADTLDSQLQGELRVMQIKGRVAELVAYALDAMLRERETGTAHFARRRDVDIVHAALARLDVDYRRPPLLDALARELGTSPNKLKALFKQAFGLTMADYCLQRRVREAQQLLMEASLTVAQVAERVGYEHQSSFTAAFRGHVGLSPREYRRHRAPFSIAVPERTEKPSRRRTNA